MIKRIISYILISLIVPVVLCSAIYFYVEPKHSNIAYVTAGIILLMLIFFTGLLIIDKPNGWQYYLMLFSILNALFVVLMVLCFNKNIVYALIGFVMANALPALIKKFKICYFLLSIAYFPMVFYTFGYQKDIWWIYAFIVVLALAVSVWLRYRKTKIYTYDNY